MIFISFTYSKITNAISICKYYLYMKIGLFNIIIIIKKKKKKKWFTIKSFQTPVQVHSLNNIKLS